MLCTVALHDELAELRAEVGPQVFEDPVAFRAAFDDFVPEGAASTGELRLLVDAIATGSLQRLVNQIGIAADPADAIAAEAEVMARDRGTVETAGARWALSVLVYARGLTDARFVSTRPAVAASSDPAPANSSPAAPPSAPRPAAPPHDVVDPGVTAARPAPPAEPAATRVASTPLPPPPPAPATSDRQRPRRLWAVLAAVLALAVVVGVGAVVLLGGDEDTDDPQRAGDSGAETSEDTSEDAAPDDGGSSLAAAPTDLPELADGFPATFEFNVRLPIELHTTINESFGEGVATEVFAGGDPLSPDAQAESGPAPSADKLRELVAAGVPARMKYYALRQVGQPEGTDAAGNVLADLLQDADLMSAYWTNVRDLLTELGGIDAPVELLPEPDVSGELLSESPDATGIPTVVSSSGVEGLDGLPDTFAGWAQGWLALRDELAPQVRIGLTVSPWQVNDNFLPDLPSPAQAESWAADFGESYATLGARYDFLDNIMAYAEGGSQGEEYIGDEQFFDRLLIWLEGISAATDTRIVLDNVPVGNSVYRTLDNTDFHFRDSWVEWILGDDDFDNLIALRDAGVVGIVFGVDGGATVTTCPCDAAGDGVSNSGDQGTRSTSPHDDGGYLSERLLAYAATGGLPL